MSKTFNTNELALLRFVREVAGILGFGDLVARFHELGIFLTFMAKVCRLFADKYYVRRRRVNNNKEI